MTDDEAFEKSYKNWFYKFLSQYGAESAYNISKMDNLKDALKSSFEAGFAYGRANPVVQPMSTA